MLTIIEIINRIHGEDFKPEPEKLPTPKAKIEIGGLTIPLFSEILGIEAQLIDERQRCLADLDVKFDTVLDCSYDPAFPTKAPRQVKVKNVLESYRTGEYKTSTYAETPLKPDMKGVAELKAVADKFGVSVFQSYYPVLNGAVSQDLAGVINQYDDAWYNNGVQGSDALERCNNILLGEPTIKFSKMVSRPVKISEDIVTYEDVRIYNTLTDRYFIPYLLIYTRTGNGTRFLDYMPIGQVAKCIQALANELEPDPQVSKNLETEYIESSKNASDAPPLSVEPSIAIQQSVPPVETSEIAKDESTIVVTPQLV